MMRKWIVLISVLAILAASLGANTAVVRAQTVYVSYTVQKGDTLGKIAREYCTTWNTIYALNRDTIGKNPNVITPGMVLLVPSNCRQAVQLPEGIVVDRGPITHATGNYIAPYYTVAWGDNLSSIGSRFDIPWRDIAKANNITGTTVYANSVLLIPGGVPGVITPPTGQGSIERVNFPKGSNSASLTGIIYKGSPRNYVLWGGRGQTLTVSTVSHGEPLVITIGNTRGDLLPLIGVNSQVRNNVSALLPETGDYIVTIRPTMGTESPELVFDITFTIR